MEKDNKKKSNLCSNTLFYGSIVVMAIWMLASANWAAGIAWVFAIVGWWAFDKEQKFYDELLSLYRNHLDKCQTKEEDYKREIAELKYQEEARKARIKELNNCADDLKNANIDHILEVGRDFQMQDTFRGAQFDTVKLLCDTIVMLRAQAEEKGYRNCDIYDTVETALGACHEDRGYCKSPIDERKSTIQFMLQDARDNSWNKYGLGKEDK